MHIMRYTDLMISAVGPYCEKFFQHNSVSWNCLGGTLLQKKESDNFFQAEQIRSKKKIVLAGPAPSWSIFSLNSKTCCPPFVLV